MAVYDALADQLSAHDRAAVETEDRVGPEGSKLLKKSEATSREVRNRSEAGLASSAMLPSDTPTVTAPGGAPQPGRPQRRVSTTAPGATEPAESGTAEPKVEGKTEDKDVPDASARRAEKPTLAAPATPAAKVDFVDSSEKVESVEWSRFKV